MSDNKKSISEDFANFSSEYPEDAYIKKLVLEEGSTYSSPRKVNDLGVDFVYATQHQYALKWLMQIAAANPSALAGLQHNHHYHCLDIGSQFSFVSIAATIANFIIVDPSLNLINKEGERADRTRNIDLGLMWADFEAQDMSFLNDSDMKVVTSLHAIEHFGLGRYGDTIDPEGDIKGIREINRVLDHSGFFIGSVPIGLSGSEKVEFNRNRIYSISMMQKILSDSGFNVIDHAVATTSDAIVHNDPEIGDYTATSMNPHEFEQAMTHVLESDPAMKENPPDAAYIWLAKKVRNA